MSRAKKRIRWRRVRILKPYNYYFHAGAKAHLPQPVSQPVTSAGSIMNESHAGLEGLDKVDKSTVAQASVFQSELGNDKSQDESTELLPNNIEEAAREEAIEPPIAVFEPGQNPYIYYLQQVPVMLTSLPQEVAIPALSNTEESTELVEVEHKDVNDSEQCGIRHDNTQNFHAAQYGETQESYDRAPLFWPTPKWNRVHAKNQRQGVKSPQAADLPVRFGGHVLHHRYYSEFVTAVDKQLRKYADNVMSLALCMHAPYDLSVWLTQLPLGHLNRLLNGQTNQSVSKMTVEHLIAACISHGANSLVNEAHFAENLLAHMHCAERHEFHGTPEQFMRWLLTQQAQPEWILLKQFSRPLLCEPLSRLVRSAPWSMSAHVEHILDWHQPFEITMFTLPENVGACLAEQIGLHKKRWQPYLTMPLLEFMYSQQSLPRSPNFSSAFLNRIDAST
ncbi:hypothetical protein [Pseudoalteromonas luteoviolacea]|uniref:hypothetical protein n=1 Tax=Pseudoalteromonas luteoviolacea TaxID=43657 RepID=UPI0011504167|nr:hypothetical protein [Pseudoalteromonas luteoviolacea]TQF72451.1 hypothetical protein FLM44_15965 [Pseudoalteromonas luteoviolacea]